MKLQIYDTKFALAMEELEAKSVSQYRTIPLVPKLARRFGFELRPPHYRSFVFNIFYYMFCFAFFWLIFTNLPNIRDIDAVTVNDLIFEPLSTGLFYGLFVAAYCKFSARHNSLTPWEEL